MLRLPVKINGVNNLSDARYCAGMGVEMIGFSVSDNHDRFMPSNKINGIAGWISGVKLVAEGYFGERLSLLNEKKAAISAQYLEIETSFYKNETLNPDHILFKLDLLEFIGLRKKLPEDAVLHVALTPFNAHEFELMKEITASHTTFFNISQLDLAKVETLLTNVHPYGVSLDGGNELSPGLKDFEHLAEVLEFLEA